MTTGDLYYQLAAAGVTLFVEADRLRFRAATEGAYTPELRQAVAAHRAELLAVLAWNEAAVAAELQAALSAIEALSWLNAAQRQLLAVFRQQVEDYQARRDPLLFGAAAWIASCVAHWKIEHKRRIAAA